MKTVAPIGRQLEELGTRVASIRLARNLTQSELAKLAGSSRSTIGRLEAGESVSLETFIRVLAALDIPTTLDAVLPDPSVRPVERVRRQKQERQRARASGPANQKASEWAWGEGGED